MEIRLKQRDIEEAIAMFLASQGVARPVSNISFTMGRGGSGLSADVECSEPAPGFVASIPRGVDVEPKTAKPEEPTDEEQTSEQTGKEEPAAEEPRVTHQAEVGAGNTSLFTS